jgi:hypothetical protein
LIQILHAIPTINVSESLLCLPGRLTQEGTKHDNDVASDQNPVHVRLDPFSVSVHPKAPDDTSETIINLNMILNNAGAVILNNMAIKDCRRDWEWNSPQVPYTFPVNKPAERPAEEAIT